MFLQYLETFDVMTVVKRYIRTFDVESAAVCVLIMRRRRVFLSLRYSHTLDVPVTFSRLHARYEHSIGLYACRRWNPAIASKLYVHWRAASSHWFRSLRQNFARVVSLTAV